jgi:hypothetical protein
MSENIILKCENLTKIYGDEENKTIALDDVSFTVKKGQLVSIIGASGSGKSTLLHLLGGVDNPTSGTVFIKDINIHQLTEDKLAEFRRKEIGIIYQFYNLLPIMNVKENITLPRELDKRKINEKELDELIHILGLEDRVTHLPNQLSGGQQQRVAIGRALINHPSLILADEPTGNLDSKSSKEIIELLKISNKRYNQTILLVTHDEKIAKEADRIITIKDGKIFQDIIKDER